MICNILSQHIQQIMYFCYMAHQIEYTTYIEIDPEVRFGRPVIKGTRITVYDVLGWLASGLSHQEIIEDFPQVSDEAILACLAYAANKERTLKVG